MSELNECPFCGRSNSFSMNEIEIHNPLGIDSELYNAKCRHCGIQTENFKTEDELIRFWNRRPAEDALTAENERLKADLEMQKNLTEEAFKEADKWQKMFYDFVEKRAKVSTNAIPIDIGKGGEDE